MKSHFGIGAHYGRIIFCLLFALALLAPHFSHANCTSPVSGIVSWWQCENNALDSIDGNDGAFTGSVTFPLGEVGLAFNLNNTNSYVKIPASSNLNVGLGTGFTLEAWINPMDVNQLHPIFEWNDGSSQGFGVHFYISQDAGPGSLYANITDSGGGWHMLHSTVAPVISNAWQHVALTYDKTTGIGTIYCNGLIVGQQNLGSFTPRTAFDLYLGKRPADEKFGYIGSIDEPAIYNRALSSNEIAAIYNAGSAGKCAPPTSGDELLLHYPFDGNAMDTSGNGHDGQINNTAFGPDRLGQSNSACYFNGQDAYLIVPDSAKALNFDARSNHYTVAMWVNLVNTAVEQDIIIDRASPNNPPSSYTLRFVPGYGFIADCWDGSINLEVASVTQPQTNHWYHVAAVYDAGAVKLYIDGNQELAQGEPGAPTNMPPNYGSTLNGETARTIGRIAPFYNNYVNGALDDVRIYGRALSASEVQQLAGITSSLDNGLLLHYPFDGNALDTSGNGHNGQINGAILGPDRFGQSNSVYNFNGQDAYIVIPDSAKALNFDVRSNNFTINLWVKLADTTQRQEIIMDRATLGNQHCSYDLVFLPPYGFIADCWDGITNVEVASTTFPESNRWYQITMSVEAKTIKLYVNGNQEMALGEPGAPTNIPATYGNTLNTETDRTIGRFAGLFYGNYFNGALDDIRIYGRPLSTNEIQELYELTPPTVNSPPVADASATVLLVISPNDTNATVILDGTLSYDTDGDMLQYFWYDAQSNSLATGVVAVVVLPIGTNLVTLAVSDSLASSQQTIAIEVITLVDAVNHLKDVVNSDVDKKNALLSSLNAALAAIDRSNPTAAVNQLLAFQNKVSSQIAPLDPVLAQMLIDEAQSIIDTLVGTGDVHSHISAITTTQANGKVHLKFSGPHPKTYIIEASTDLSNWEKIGIAKDNGDGTFDFDDTKASKKSARFYRIVVP